MTDITIILINIMMGALGVLMTGLTILNAVSEVTPSKQNLFTRWSKSWAVTLDFLTFSTLWI